ncbi:hypothetical protein LGK95_09175 [Clostridium algoriphilum]|uniref:hypothetical protein n=1 Tax=Clostridium algoriphilum TaxID=198347 RepID=UPI001CF2460D|nr:hypothetical protein [Clostridium algoriphilum]MCB2293695.1 hypothetical protein [Clostridium algoriphilum]
MSDIWMCVRNIRGATEGKLFLGYGDIYKVIEKIRLTRMDKEIRLFVSNEEIHKFFKKVENSYSVYGVWTAKSYNNFLRKLLNIKLKKELGHSRVNLEVFDKYTLYRIYTELLLCLYKVRSNEFLIQFSTIIRYQLESLKMIYENKDLVDFDEEFEQTVIQFKKIYEFCKSMESKAELIELDYRGKVIKELMVKRKEINRLNILMLDEINKMKD